MTDNRAVTRMFWIIAGAVALIAAGSFVWSFLALWELAAANSAQPALGWVWPLITDLSMCVYTGAILVSQLQRRPARLPIGLTIFYALVTIAGNVLHAPAAPLAWFVAILPPLSLIFGAEMLRTMGHHIIERAATVASLAELSTIVETRRADLESITRQFEQTAAKLEATKGELKALQLAQNARSISELNAVRAAKIDARRQDVLSLLSEGMEPKAIADELGFSVRTVRNDIKQLNGKAGVSQ